MKNRVNNIDDAKEIICDFHGRKIEIIGCRGLEKVSVKRIIPMTYPKDKHISDVEILTNKQKNHYFSIGAILKNESKITSLKVGGVNMNSRAMRVISPTPKDEIDWIRTARYINLLKMKMKVNGSLNTGGEK